MTSTLFSQSFILSSATAMTALFTTACTPDTNQQPTDPIAVTLTGTPYERHCIADKVCDATQRRNATLDYLGAMYTSDSALVFDGVLTPSEEKNATKIFGADIKPEQLPALYPKAQRSGLSTSISRQQALLCNDIGLWHLLTASDSNYGEATAIVGVHRCFNQFSSIFNVTQLEPRIAAKPADWVFFVEISPEMELDKKQGKNIAKDEIALLYRIAERLEIPVENPIVPFNNQAVTKALANQGISRMDQAVSWALLHIMSDLFANPAFQKKIQKKTPAQQAKIIYDELNKYITSKTAHHSVISGTLQVYGLSATNFYKAAQNFIKPKAGEAPYAALVRTRTKISSIMKQGVKLATEQTTQHIKGRLKHHGRKRALYQVGVPNAGVLKGVYPGLKGIPLTVNGPGAKKPPKTPPK